MRLQIASRSVVERASEFGVLLINYSKPGSAHAINIYYLIRNLVDAEIRYSHVEKLALATVHVVQRLRHYILLF